MIPARSAIFLLLLLAACDPAPEAPPLSADTVFLGGDVYTVDSQLTRAEAVAIRDGVIVYVGDNAGARAWVGAATTSVNLGGRMMLPAFQDSHIHPIGSGVEAAQCDLNGLADLDSYRRAIRDYANANPDLPWITGGGWSMAVFGPGAAPSKAFIDDLVPDRPVFLVSQDGHTGWANSRALELAGINRDTPDPRDGLIDRDPLSGDIVGSLQEGAMALVADLVPAVTVADRIRGLEYARDLLHAYGITSFTDASVRREDLLAYRELLQRGELNMRVVASLRWDRNQGLEQVEILQDLRAEFEEGGLLRAGTVKIMQDGVMENYTAAMLEPYFIPGGSRGISMIAPDTLNQIVTELDRVGFQVHFHAIGDRAIRESLDAVAAARETNGPSGLRHHISHLQIIHPDDFSRFAELEVIANFQPVWAYNDAYVTELTVPFIGEDRAQWMYPMKSIEDAGGMIAFGSDWSVTTANPFPQIETAVTRLDPGGDSVPVMQPQERLSLESALLAFTRNAAYLNGHEERTGSIEVGKLADVIVLDRNL
ncbi:MAG: amidohydrolase, partial [Gammaproteobacteria bacterium]